MRHIITAVWLLLFGVSAAQADVTSSMQSFWNKIGTSNVTGPTAFSGQSGGYYTGGNIHARVPTSTVTPVTVNLPSYRAGCGGIDVFTGGFSHINSTQLVALMRNIGTNAVGYAFKLGLETISPMIAEQIGSLQDIAQTVNNANINSCEAAKGIVGGIWPQADTASRVICEDLGNSSGIFTDRAAARHGCGTGGSRAGTLNSASGSMKDQLVTDVNLAWKSLQSNSLFSGDKTLAELVMNLSGTIVVTAPSTDSAAPQFKFFGHKADNPNIVKALMDGGSVQVNTCSDTNCLNLTSGTVTIPATAGFKARVAALLTSIQSKVGTNAALTSDELKLLNSTGLPLYKIINVQTAYRGALGTLDLATFAEFVALDILYQYLQEQLGHMKDSGNALALASESMLTRWRDEINDARSTLYQAKAGSKTNFNQVLTVVEQVRAVETYLANRLSGNGGSLALLDGRTE